MSQLKDSTIFVVKSILGTRVARYQKNEAADAGPQQSKCACVRSKAIKDYPNTKCYFKMGFECIINANIQHTDY